MDKKAYLEEIRYAAMIDELQKEASIPIANKLLPKRLVGAPIARKAIARTYRAGKRALDSDIMKNKPVLKQLRNIIKPIYHGGARGPDVSLVWITSLAVPVPGSTPLITSLYAKRRKAIISGAKKLITNRFK